MSYPVVLFDLDHTLLDTDRSFGSAFEATMSSIGIEQPASVRSMFDAINAGLWHEVERGTLHTDDLHQRRFASLIEQLDLEADPASAARCWAERWIETATLYEDAARLIEQTASQSRTALVTNGVGLMQRGVLRALGLEETFDAVVISGEVGANKPDPAIFDATFAALGVADRSRAVMVGDSLTSDIQGGINAGIDTIWFNPDFLDPGNVEPSHIVYSLEELIDLLRV